MCFTPHYCVSLHIHTMSLQNLNWGFVEVSCLQSKIKYPHLLSPVKTLLIQQMEIMILTWNDVSVSQIKLYFTQSGLYRVVQWRSRGEAWRTALTCVWLQVTWSSPTLTSMPPCMVNTGIKGFFKNRTSARFCWCIQKQCSHYLTNTLANGDHVKICPLLDVKSRIALYFNCYLVVSCLSLQ